MTKTSALPPEAS